MASQSKIQKLPVPPDAGEGFDASLDGSLGISLEATLGDLRFRALLSEAEWALLPPATRQRFSKRSRRRRDHGLCRRGRGWPGSSRLGWWVAQLARLIGGPLPTRRTKHRFR